MVVHLRITAKPCLVYEGAHCLFETIWDTSRSALDAGHAAGQIARFPKENGSRARTVVVTQGKDPTVIAFNGKVRGQYREKRARLRYLRPSMAA